MFEKVTAAAMESLLAQILVRALHKFNGFEKCVELGANRRS
jgi:hypothetical protein